MSLGSQEVTASRGVRTRTVRCTSADLVCALSTQPMLSVHRALRRYKPSSATGLGRTASHRRVLASLDLLQVRTTMHKASALQENVSHC